MQPTGFHEGYAEAAAQAGAPVPINRGIESGKRRDAPAAPEGYARLYVDEGPAVKELPAALGPVRKIARTRTTEVMKG